MNLFEVYPLNDVTIVKAEGLMFGILTMLNILTCMVAMQSSALAIQTRIG
jgi:hypothetical protein